MNLLLIIMNSYVIIWFYMNKHDFVYKRISNLEHSFSFFINIFSPGMCEKVILSSWGRLRLSEARVKRRHKDNSILRT